MKSLLTLGANSYSSQCLGEAICKAEKHFEILKTLIHYGNEYGKSVLSIPCSRSKYELGKDTLKKAHIFKTMQCNVSIGGGSLYG